MYLVIAEKPSVSKAIAEVIGASKKEEGYLEGKGCIVSWCFGHLAEYVPPDSYDERFTRWLYEDLPKNGNWQYPKIRKNSSIF
jgi:DNA topoisomerase-3